MQGIGEYTDLETTAAKTTINFKDRFTAEKLMYGTANGELPSIGKVEMAWVQTPLPPVDLSKLNKTADVVALPASSAQQPEDQDVAMHESAPATSDNRGNEATQDLDYEVADDGEWEGQ